MSDSSPFIAQVERNSQWTIGVCCIVGTAVIWTFATMIKKYLTEGQDNAYGVTCLLNSIYVLHFATYGVSQYGATMAGTARTDPCGPARTL